MTQERTAQLFTNGIFMFLFAFCLVTFWDQRQEPREVFFLILGSLLVLLTWFYFLFGGIIKIGTILKRKSTLTATQWVLFIDNAQARACLSPLPAEFVMKFIIKDKLQKAKRTAIKTRRKELTDESMRLLLKGQVARAISVTIQAVPYYKETPDFLEIHLREMVEFINLKKGIPINGDVRSFQFSLLLHFSQGFLKEAIAMLENKPKKQKEEAINETIDFLLNEFGLLKESIRDNLEKILLN